MTDSPARRKDEKYGDNEAQERFHKALEGAFKAPHKPQKAMRKGLPSQSKKRTQEAVGKAGNGGK